MTRKRNQQPDWELLWSTDYSAVFVDRTGVYAPEMEVAFGDADADQWYLWRFSLDRLKWVKGFLVPEIYQSDWSHPVSAYEEWFMDSLGDIANSIGSTEQELTDALTSADPSARAFAYEAIGGYHGYDNLDGYPERMSTDEFDDYTRERW